MTGDTLHSSQSRMQLPTGPNSDRPDSYAAFGVANYYGEVIAMLRFRFSDDTWRAFPYYSLGEVSYDPALGVELNFHSTVMRIRGRNLYGLFSQIGDHAVRWCWEADRAASLQTPESEPVIERIEFGAAKVRTPSG